MDATTAFQGIRYHKAATMQPLNGQWSKGAEAVGM